jgi:hypothetical protein
MFADNFWHSSSGLNATGHVRNNLSALPDMSCLPWC